LIAKKYQRGDINTISEQKDNSDIIYIEKVNILLSGLKIDRKNW